MSGKRKITAEIAVKILKKNNIEVDEKEAEIILEFMYFLGELSVSLYFKDFNNDESA